MSLMTSSEGYIHRYMIFNVWNKMADTDCSANSWLNQKLQWKILLWPTLNPMRSEFTRLYMILSCSLQASWMRAVQCIRRYWYNFLGRLLWGFPHCPVSPWVCRLSHVVPLRTGAEASEAQGTRVSSGAMGVSPRLGQI